MRRRPSPRGVLPVIGVVLGILAILAAARNGRLLAGLLTAAAVTYWIAPRYERLTLFLTTPLWIVRNEERDVELYATNPRYRAMVIRTLRRQEDRAYRRRVDQAKTTWETLVGERDRRLAYLRFGEWAEEDGLRVNAPLGQIMIDQRAYDFSAIRGARVTTAYGEQIEKEEHGEEEQKRRPSVGGAVVGGLVGGVVGAAVGAAFFSKKTTGTDRRTRGRRIPVCTYVGVSVDLDGFVCDIPVLDHMVDQGTPAYADAMAAASALVVRLRELARTPMPERFARPEEAPEILRLDQRISQAEEVFRAVSAETPTYDLPARYGGTDPETEETSAGREGPEEVTVICPGCGAPVRLLPGAGGECAYCGSPVRDEASP